ncbi:hypothetical protein LMOf2365_0554 [Listeria monocytogenes serotype 4b str. F2365]|nr:hypothetical protein LMOf2365_0554 [Listeria monocytogenes serotype 4b str. F2365]ASH37411.1 hypothetical protein A410_0542 [Listeria monocytogenes serotype 1/2b str. 10-0811]
MPKTNKKSHDFLKRDRGFMIGITKNGVNSIRFH